MASLLPRHGLSIRVPQADPRAVVWTPIMMNEYGRLTFATEGEAKVYKDSMMRSNQSLELLIEEVWPDPDDYGT